MKKRLIDKIPEEVKGKQKIEKEQVKKEQEIDTFTSINCDCCEESTADIPLTSSPSEPSSRARGAKVNESVKVDEHDHEDYECNDCGKPGQRNLFNNTKLLIVIGLAATIPIVLLELLLP
ncbi:MAG: hypothetical protein ACRD47_10250, partial [Nitrososphaeraceae archaeon]